MAATETALINGPAGRIELIIDTPERVRGIALVCHPHPLFHGANTNKVAHTLARIFRDLGYAALFMAVAYGYALLVNLASLTIEELTFHKYPRWRDLGHAVVASVAENFGYRQLTALWRTEGLWQGIRGGKHVWGTMTRSGFDTGGQADSASASAREVESAGAPRRGAS